MHHKLLLQLKSFGFFSTQKFSSFFFKFVCYFMRRGFSGISNLSPSSIIRQKAVPAPSSSPTGRTNSVPAPSPNFGGNRGQTSKFPAANLLSPPRPRPRITGRGRGSPRGGSSSPHPSTYAHECATFTYVVYPNSVKPGSYFLSLLDYATNRRSVFYICMYVLCRYFFLISNSTNLDLIHSKLVKKCNEMFQNC